MRIWMNYFTIKDLPLEERPRERLMHKGADALSATELLAVLLGSGMKGKSVLHLAQEVLSHFGSLKAVEGATVEELLQIRGLGRAKAIQIKAALGLASRLSQEPQKQISITTPQEVYDSVKDLFIKEKRELFGVLLQNSRGKMICCEIVSIGTLNKTLVHPREVFYPAIRHRAASLILIHNHPSGDPTPSKEDIEVTRSLIQVGRLMNIPVQDHVIITPGKFVSLWSTQHLALGSM